ncbi:restriction endonuclease subunit S [Mucilaginibacter sp.]|uniref:restriction endonuclease subunit S n=1 Tax=Mucilaginibacter sp. TaxID=1882438 RepID=UPI003D0BB67D
MITPKLNKKIPKGWEWTTLSQITVPVTKTNKNNENPSEHFKYIDIEAIDNEKFEIKELKTYSWNDAPSRAQQKVLTNDILFANVRPYLKNIAMVPALYNNQIASTGFCVIRPFIINPKYLFYYVTSQQFIDEVNKFAKGTSYPAVTNNVILEQGIPIPPLNQQNSIVNKIEELFTDLQNAEKSFNDSLNRLIGYKHQCLNDAFNGKLTNRWREQFVNQSEIRSNSMKESQLPIGWQWSKVKNVALIIMGQSPKGSSYNDKGHGTPLINGPVEFGPTPFSYTQLKKWTTEPNKMCTKGDLLICVRGSTTGRLNIAGFTACLGRGVAAIRATSVEQSFLNHYFNFSTRKIFDMGTGTTFPNVSHDQLADLPIPVMSDLEQKQIVQEIEYRITTAENLEETILKNLKKVQIYRQIILTKAFEGELIKADSTVETAAQFLETLKNKKEDYLQNVIRIKAETPQKKYMKKTLIEILQETFNEKEFSYEDLKETVGLSYEDIKTQLFKLLETQKILSSTFDKNSGRLILKLIK